MTIPQAPTNMQNPEHFGPIIFGPGIILIGVYRGSDQNITKGVYSCRGDTLSHQLHRYRKAKRVTPVMRYEADHEYWQEEGNKVNQTGGEGEVWGGTV